MINPDTAPTPPDPHAQTEDRIKNPLLQLWLGELVDGEL